MVGMGHFGSKHLGRSRHGAFRREARLEKWSRCLRRATLSSLSAPLVDCVLGSRSGLQAVAVRPEGSDGVGQASRNGLKGAE